MLPTGHNIDSSIIIVSLMQHNFPFTLYLLLGCYNFPCSVHEQGKLAWIKVSYHRRLQVFSFHISQIIGILAQGHDVPFKLVLDNILGNLK